MSWSYTSPNLEMPYLLPSQAQKHVTVNEALRTIDALSQLAVASRSIASPPSTPSEGERYIVASPATGAWSGKEDSIAAFMDGGWYFHLPKEGFNAWVIDDEEAVFYDGADWQPVVPDVTGASIFGVNATADTTNRLAVSATATLFSHAGSGHQTKINKAAAGDTASLLFQTGGAGRAEIGLPGTDDLTVKVYGTDSVWRTALSVDRTTAAVTMPNTTTAAGASLIAIARDIKTSGTDGGSFSSGPRRTRDLNTLTQAVSGVASLSLNSVTVPAGTFYFRWSCPAYKVGGHRTWLRDTTHSLDLGYGDSSASGTADTTQTVSTGQAVATFAGSTAVRLEHRGTATQTTNGFGVSSGFGDEAYSSLEIWRL